MRRCYLQWLVGLFIAFMMPAPHAVAQEISLPNLPNREQLPPDLVGMQDSEGYWWYGGRGTGLCRFDGYETEAFRSDRRHPHLLLSNDVLCMAEHRDSSEIWFGTKDGAYILSKRDYSLRPVELFALPTAGESAQSANTSTTAVQKEELANKRITCITAAADGTMWLSYRNQLLHLSAKSQLLHRFETSWYGKSRSITCLCFDEDGNLWAGLWNGGLVRLMRRSDPFLPGLEAWELQPVPWTRPDYPARLFWHSDLRALKVQTSSEVSLFFDLQSQRWTEDDDATFSVDGATVVPPPTAWVDSLMSRLAPHNDAAILSRAVLPDGRVYVGSYHSLFLCDSNHIELVQGNLDKVRSMDYSESSKALYLLSKARGVCCWQNNRLTILCDTTRFLQLQLVGDSALLLSDNLTGTFQYHLQTHQLTPDTTKADVLPRVTACSLDGRKQLLGYGQQTLSVPHATALVEVWLTTLDFEHAARVQYAYRLSDDAPWTELSEGEHVIRLVDLPVGSSRLEVRATDLYGRWSAPVTVLTLERSSCWYDSAWLWLLVGLLLLVGAYLLYKVRERRRALVVSSDESTDPKADESQSLSVADREFLDKAASAVMMNITNTEYSVDALASDLCMSRANLHRKMRSITGTTPTEFIRNQRLERAAELLRTTSCSVNEIADLVGFSYASYFTKCFKEKYGVLPKDY